MYNNYDCPCKDCNKRHISCHSECNEYKKWSEENTRKNAEIRKQKIYDYTDNYFLPSRRGKRKIGS